MSKVDILKEVNTILDNEAFLWEHCPEDRIEERTSWEDLEETTTRFYYLILQMKAYIEEGK